MPACTVSEYALRLADLLRRYLGETVLRALVDPDIEEVYVNPDMRVRLVSRLTGRLDTGAMLGPSEVEAFLRAIATFAGTEVSRGRPSLAAALPQEFGKCRLQGFLPPLTEGPALIIRKPPARAIELEEYVNQGALSSEGFEIISGIVRERHNVIVAGPTASGKTTLCGAIIAAITRQFPLERVIILEDTPELLCHAADQLRLRTTDQVTMRQLVKYSLRATPDRIIIGEVRDGAAKDLLDAWITGHPGGCGTVHGEDCDAAVTRLAELAREGAGGVDQMAMVHRAVRYVVLITGHGTYRRVRRIARLKGGRLEHILSES